MVRKLKLPGFAGEEEEEEGTCIGTATKVAIENNEFHDSFNCVPDMLPRANAKPFTQLSMNQASEMGS
jgi:hypothetical protein